MSRSKENEIGNNGDGEYLQFFLFILVISKPRQFLTY